MYDWRDECCKRIENFLQWEADTRPNLLDLGEATIDRLSDIDSIVDYVRSIQESEKKNGSRKSS